MADGNRKVRVEGSADEWEVLAETESTLLLVNPAARDRRQIDELEEQLARAQNSLALRRAALDSQ